MNEILAKIEAHQEQTRRLNDELLAERDATQAKIEQLTSYRYELDSTIQRLGIRPNMAEEFAHTATRDPRIVKRTRRENEEYVASVPVEKISENTSIRQAMRDVCSDGQKRTKAEIFLAVQSIRNDAKYLTFATMFSKIGFHSEPNDRPGAKRTTRLYWLPKNS